MTRKKTDPTSVFSIGTQQADNISNVAGDQTIYGGMNVRSDVAVANALQDVEALLTMLARLDLTPAERDQTRKALTEVKQELGKPKPDTTTIAKRLEEATRTLRQAGMLAGAGAALVAPLARLANWLGPLGASLVRLLPL
jgi:hypothetical protein